MTGSRCLFHSPSPPPSPRFNLKRVTLRTLVHRSFQLLPETANKMSILHHCALLRPPLLPQYTIYRQSPHRSPIQISSPTTHRKTLIRSSPDLFTQIEGDNVGVNNLGSDDSLGIDESLFSRRPFEGREGDKDFDRDPEVAEIIGSCLDDPDKARSKMEERLRRKRNNILHTKTGSAVPMKVKFNKFDFSNSYIWFEFYNVPLEKDVTLICDTIRSWHIVGRLGGCNSMNMQLSQSCFDKRPNYDAIQGGNVTPTTFYNIGDLEVQDNLARIWVDIGTSEALLLDVLINALTQLSSDYIGIKQLVFGGTEFENWREDLKTEDAGYSLHSI